jgi:hypothetical protein
VNSTRAGHHLTRPSLDRPKTQGTFQTAPPASTTAATELRIATTFLYTMVLHLKVSPILGTLDRGIQAPYRLTPFDVG